MQLFALGCVYIPMKDLIAYSKRKGWISIIKIPTYILLTPFFVLHELSHLIVLTLLSIPYKIETFKIFNLENDGGFAVFEMTITVDGNVDLKHVTVAIAPSITYYILLIFSVLNLFFDVNVINIIFVTYVIFGSKIGCSSDVDKEIIKSYISK